ncbi:MAG: hypothetical protein CSA62_08970 [Planctomycetota bacterium]|nr:MAG: hypothetical protein CSA62_08970 [Planctomycetota bacterium]
MAEKTQKLRMVEIGEQGLSPFCRKVEASEACGSALEQDFAQRLHLQEISHSVEFLLWQAHGEAAAKFLLPARSFLEESGYWVHNSAKKEPLRPPHRRGLSSPHDLELLSEFAAAPQEQNT